MQNIQGSKIACLNVASLLKHIDEFRILMNNKKIHVLAINETRLDNSIPIQLITVQGYSWIYKHRNRSGGGVGFYIKDSINYRIRSDLNDPDIEILTIEIFEKNINPFLITIHGIAHLAIQLIPSINSRTACN